MTHVRGASRVRAVSGIRLAAKIGFFVISRATREQSEFRCKYHLSSLVISNTSLFNLRIFIKMVIMLMVELMSK